MLGVIVTYKLIGNDHIKAINNNTFLEIKEEIIVKQAGIHSMKNVFKMGSISVVFE